MNTGCVPSKALLAAAHARHVALDARRFPGVSATAGAVDMPALTAGKNSLGGVDADREVPRPRRRVRADYLADVEVNTRQVDNPARKKATTALANAEEALADAERALARLLSDPTLTVSLKNASIPHLQERITRAGTAVTRTKAVRDTIPAKLPANEVDPDATRALLRTRRRGLQMVLRLLAYNAEHYLATALNAYLRDDDEYRALTRATILRGTDGTITYTPDRIDVTLERPNSPRLAHALGLLLEEINTTPPRIPGDPRPISYQIAPG